ncbi:hypothetical protein [Streptomyces mutomycini]|uniref:hypothetical protein n=1 Tax=Streptomyces mutomycini TaxID=284036 RepID=UPI0033CCBCD7
MSDSIATIPLSPSMPVEVVVNFTRHTVDITKLDVIHPDMPNGITTIFASNEMGVQAVYSTANTDIWPAWLAKELNKGEHPMGQGITVGDIVLSGTAYYRVTDVFPRKFRGQEWDESGKGWGPLRDVPNPSPTTTAQVLSVAETALLFPGESY